MTPRFRRVIVIVALVAMVAAVLGSSLAGAIH
jgi:hypothetical protein